MYLAEYEDPQLGGFFKSLKKAVKKIAKPALHIGAAIATGGASLSVTAQMLAQKKARKAAEEQAKRDAAEFDRQAAVLKQVQAAPTTALAPVAPPAAPVTTITSVAPTQAAVQQQVSQAQLLPQSFTVPQSYAPQPRERTMRVQQSTALPSWAVPAGIGAAALIAVLAATSRR